MSLTSAQITHLLWCWSEGYVIALEQLVPLLHDRPREFAHQRLGRAPAEYSSSTTALVREAYLRLTETARPSLRDRSHFLTLSSRVTRGLLADHGRAHTTPKLGGGAFALKWRKGMWLSDDALDSVAELHEALKRTEMLEPRRSEILEQPYLGGLSSEETAEATGISLAMVKRKLRSARAWLLAELTAEPSL